MSTTVGPINKVDTKTCTMLISHFGVKKTKNPEGDIILKQMKYNSNNLPDDCLWHKNLSHESSELPRCWFCSTSITKFSCTVLTINLLMKEMLKILQQTKKMRLAARDCLPLGPATTTLFVSVGEHLVSASKRIGSRKNGLQNKFMTLTAFVYG